MDPTRTDPPATDSAVDPVEQLLADCLTAPQAERGAALERALREHPEHADGLRRRIEALCALGIELSPKDEPDFPEQLGDFRLMRRIGGGGMGVVYLAVQTSLKRDVALKLIRPEHLFFDGARERFRREAEAVARLQHPGIVPIYTVGENEGIPWFAMECVPGRTLAEVLDELRERAPESLVGNDLRRAVEPGVGDSPPEDSLFAGTWVEACLRIAVQVAEALEHAHGRGILHRDVKPSNVMLTPDGRVLLLDFGLTSAGRGDRATRTGSQLGTLHYMSPEQVRATRDVDARTDVYSLGAALYELLTLQLPYRGDDDLETQRRIAEGSPDSIRARNRRVEPDVETVCLKAMDRDRERRYESAAAFARDLQHLLAHRPVAARPPGPLLRARRFGQRRPALATGVVLGTLLVVGTPSALLVQQTAHAAVLEGTLKDLEDALKAKDAALGEAEASARQAQASFDFLLDTILSASPDVAMGDVPDALELLDRATERVRTEFADDPALRATLQSAIGNVWAKLGRPREAVAVLEESLASWGESEGRDPIRYWGTHRDLGNALAFQEDFERAEAYLREAVELAPGLPEEARLLELRSLNALAVMLQHARRFAESRELLEELVEGYRALDHPEAFEGEAVNLLNLGQVVFETSANETQRLEEALALFEAAHRIARDELPASHPMVVETGLNVALGLKALGRTDEAEEAYAEGVERAREVYGARSLRMAPFLNNYGRLLEETGQLDRAEECYAEALERVEEHIDGVSQYHLILGQNLASLAGARGDHATAAERYRELLAPYEEVFGPDSFKVGQLYRNLATTLVKAGEYEEAIERFRESVPCLSAHAGFEAEAASSLTLAAELLVRIESDEAEAAFERALEYARANLGDAAAQTLQARRGLEALQGGD